MRSRILSSLLLGAALTFAAGSLALAQDKTVKIGVLTEVDGQIGLSGRGVAAVEALPEMTGAAPPH